MEIETILKEIKDLKGRSNDFFSSAQVICDKEDKGSFLINYPTDVNGYWDKLSDALQSKSQKVQEATLHLISIIIPALQSSPILDKSDERDVGICAKKMRSALKLRDFKSWDIEVLHDEGAVLGVSPPGQSEDTPLSPDEAQNRFNRCIEKLEGIIQLAKIAPAQILNGLPQKNPNLSQSYRPNTAFIMMPIDAQNPELEDVYDVYKECFTKFGIKAIRADDIEHEDVITKKIIEEIKTSEFLVGDLTNERPSVYYEIGYAH